MQTSTSFASSHHLTVTRRRFGAWCWRRRFWLLGATAVLLVRGMLPGLIGPDNLGVDVVVLRAELPAGQVLVASDLYVDRRPVETVPTGAITDPGLAIGGTLAVGLPADLPLVPTLLAGPGGAAGAPSGTVVVPVRLADPAVAALLRAGDRIDVLASPGTGMGTDGLIAPAERLASGALVVSSGGDQGGGLLDADGDGRLLMLAVSPAEARLIGGASSWADLSAVLVPPS